MGTSSEAIASSEPASFRSRDCCERRDPVAAGGAQAAPFEEAVELVDGDSAVGDDAGLDIGAAVELLRDDVDVGDAYALGEARGASELEHPVEAPTDHEDGIGAAEGGGAGGVHEHRVVVGNRATAHGRRHEGDAAVDEPLEGQAGLRPARTLAHDDQGALRLGKHVGDCFEGGGIGVGSRDLRFAGAPEDGVLVEGGADELCGEVEVDGAGASVEGASQGEVHVLGDARLAIDLRRPLAGGRGEGDLIGLLEGPEAALVPRRGAAQHDEGHGALGGDVHGRDRVREGGSRADDEHARLAPRPAPGRGGEARRDFVAAVHHRDALALHGRHDLDHGSGHDPEGRIDAGRLQLPRDDLSAVQFCHAVPSGFRWPQSYAPRGAGSREPTIGRRHRGQGDAHGPA